VRDLDRPPVDWTLEQYQTIGLLWWGHQPPASFLEAGPVLDRSLITTTRDLEEVAAS
jgi:catechol 2,3-dioxygenase